MIRRDPRLICRDPRRPLRYPPCVLLLSVQVGLPQNRKTGAVSWRSAIAKRAVAGPVVLGPLGLEGDAHADPRFHGGPERALLAYCAEHYQDWRAEVGKDLGAGAFGENLTVSGL